VYFGLNKYSKTNGFMKFGYICLTLKHNCNLLYLLPNPLAII
jgi:hypothetical protein